MKKIIFSFLLISSTSLLAQVGIGTNTPNNSAMLEVQSTTKGILFPRMNSIQRTSIASPAAGLHVFDITTNSLWFYNGTYWVNYAAQAKVGDVKSGIQSSDHEGWVVLDGRPLSSLSVTQQSAATAMGLSGNLPNANNAYLVQNGSSLGSVSGSNTTTLTQANLPNVTFTGTAANAGSHSHTTDPVAFSSSTTGSHAHTTDPAAVWTSVNGYHSHASNANGGAGGFGLVKSDGNSTASSADYTWGELNVWAEPIGLSIYGNGDHQHQVDIPSTTSSTEGNHNHLIDVPSTTSSITPDHSHSVTVSSGGSATPVNITPRSLTVNMFIYLGL